MSRAWQEIDFQLQQDIKDGISNVLDYYYNMSGLNGCYARPINKKHFVDFVYSSNHKKRLLYIVLKDDRDNIVIDGIPKHLFPILEKE